MRLRPVRRAALVVGLTSVVLGLASAPAAGHGGGPDSAYYRTQITGVLPQLPGVSARVDPAGEWIELTYAGAGTIVVLGYLREPYLRISANSVEENALSQTTYINQAMFADVPTVTPGPTESPRWRSVANSGTARWHDHRIHWMGQARPPMVAADPTHSHTVGAWTIQATVGATLFNIRGTIEWVGKPQGLSTTVWITLGLTNISFFALALVLSARRKAARRRLDQSRPNTPGDAGLSDVRTSVSE